MVLGVSICSEAPSGYSERAGGSVLLPTWCSAADTASAVQPQPTSLLVKLHFSKYTSINPWSQHPVLNSPNSTLRLVVRELDRAWNWYFLQKEEYCASLGRLLIESFAKHEIFQPENSHYLLFPHDFCLLQQLHLQCKPESRFAFSLFPGRHEYQRWCMAAVPSASHAAVSPSPRLVVQGGVQPAELALMSSVPQMLARREPAKDPGPAVLRADLH